MPDAHNLPDKPALEGLEKKWDEVWERRHTYRFDRDAARVKGVYSIDTPPPTASGSLHIGHVFSYTHTDVIARYQRMNGKELFYPIGWDDNGLPTERRVQNYYGVRCDTSLPYTPDFVPPFHGGNAKSSKPANQVPISRRNFIELCEKLTTEDEQQFENLWRTVGLSVDWTQSYRTISNESMATSQLAFLRNIERGEAYQADAPTLWDVTFRTAVAQAELEDREQSSAYHTLVFHGADGQDIEIQTTRPELLVSCVALVAHPDDERYQPLFGTTVRTPVFDVEVPVVAHRLAQPDKGSGIAMICTFGDVTDVVWWRELGLDNRSLLGFDGRFKADDPAWLSPEAQDRYRTLHGKTPFTARELTLAMATERGEIHGEPRKISHPVKFYEKGDKPLEIVSTRQWYIKNGAHDPELKSALVERGNELDWHPDFMHVRYDNWVEGLSGDWLISRQRYFGVPLPVWYGVDEHGEPDFEHVLTPTRDQLPVDPSIDTPPGFDETLRGKPNGFIGEVDVMDTWATSSLTPQLAGGWQRDEELWKLVAPYSLRPQAQDIIRTWLFSTVLRSQLEDGRLPWDHTTISGFIVDPDRKKMSKSKGNVVTPLGLLEQFGADAVRYWAASSKLGTDAAFDPQNPKQIKIGRRLAIKVLNAAKFVLAFDLPGADAQIVNPLDLSILARLEHVVTTATEAFEAYDHARALEATETFFWLFCDDYLELVKTRAYGTDVSEAERASAVLTLRRVLDIVLRLLAPFLVYATEEVFSWFNEDSIHNETWPTVDDVEFALLPSDLANAESVLSTVSDALIGIRRAKTDAKVKMRTEILSATIVAPEAALGDIERAFGDIKAVGRIKDLELQVSPNDSITVENVAFAQFVE